MAENILGRTKSIIEELTNSEKKVGEYILKYPESVITMTTSELADKSGASPASVIRFCKSIHVPSFTQLKVNLSAEISTPAKYGYSDIQPNEAIGDIKAKLLGNAYQSMNETVALMNNERIEETANLLQNASVIYIYGIGASHLVAENISQKWSRIGKTSICGTDSHILVSMFVSAPKNSVFIGVSNSGETTEVIRLIDIAKKHGIKTIGLSQFGQNTVSSTADISLQTVRANEAELRSAATSSLHAQFIAVDILFYVYATRNYEQNIKHIQKSRQDVEEYKN